MRRTNPYIMILFVGVITALAVIIHVGEGRREKRIATEIEEKQRKESDAVAERQRKEKIQADADQEAETERQRKLDADAAAQKAAQNAADEHDRFVAQYENTNIIKTPGIEMIAVACATENGTMNPAMSAALINRFKTNNVELVSSFFRPTLITEGMFDSVYNGSGDTFKKLDLAKYVDGLLLARQQVEYSTNASLDNVITANMRLEVASLAISGQIQNQGWTFTANGAAFRPAEARMQAEERILKQIAANPTMSLTQINANH